MQRPLSGAFDTPAASRCFVIRPGDVPQRQRIRYPPQRTQDRQHLLSLLGPRRFLFGDGTGPAPREQCQSWPAARTLRRDSRRAVCRSRLVGDRQQSQPAACRVVQPRSACTPAKVPAAGPRPMVSPVSIEACEHQARLAAHQLLDAPRSPRCALRTTLHPLDQRGPISLGRGRGRRAQNSPAGQAEKLRWKLAPLQRSEAGLPFRDTSRNGKPASCVGLDVEPKPLSTSRRLPGRAPAWS